MKSPKLLMVLIILLLAGTTTVFAQTTKGNLSEEQKAQIKENVQAYARALNLSDVQQPEFEVITKKYAKQMISIRDSGSGKFKKMRQLRAMGKEKNAEMKKLLDENQYAIYLDKQEEMREKMKARRGNL